MKFVKLQCPYFLELSNVRIKNIYQSTEGKGHFYGILGYSHEHEPLLQKMKEDLQKKKPFHYNLVFSINTNNILRMKFPTHYGRPKYKAIKENGLPTVASAIQERLEKEEIFIDVVLKIEGYVCFPETNNCDFVLQCDKLYIRSK